MMKSFMVLPPKIRPYVLLLFTFLLFNCSTSQKRNEDGPFRIPASTAQQAHFYMTEVQPLLTRRCVVCHTCTDAPCQLQLDSYEGIRRGATYGDLGISLLYSKPTRSKDGRSLEEWRQKSFFPVLPDPNETSSGSSTLPLSIDSERSLLYRFAELGHQKNKSGFDLKPINQYREQTHACVPNTTAFEALTKEHAFIGMPFGLPGLSRKELDILKIWIDQGAPAPVDTALAYTPQGEAAAAIYEWETFFNSTNKAQLTARYIYEHMFSAHIHFKGTSPWEWYELVRSSTRAPHPIDEIVTPRPYDEPLGKKVFYRFNRIQKAIARPAHIPWEIDAQALAHYKELFLKTVWVQPLENKLAEFEPIFDPGYTSTNPFTYFKQIPTTIRYQFLLENSQVIANAMIRGPACSGRTATNAIRDHFWVFFLKPEADVTVLYPEIGVTEWAPLNELDLKLFAKPSLQYTTAMQKTKPQGYGLSDLWTGEGTNPNSLLTIFRHGTNASVHTGLLGGTPPTLWVLNYSNFERIYYNLVADFEPWGSSTHKAATWNYMSRHRSEAEERFISFLPENYRRATRFSWTRGLGSAMNLSQALYSKGIKSQVEIKDRENPVLSLIQLMLNQYQKDQITPPQQIDALQPVPTAFINEIKTLADWEDAFFKRIQHKKLNVAKFVPDILYLRIEDSAYTILNHRSFKFNNILALEKLAYDPSGNRLALLRGEIGDRPEYFAQLTLPQLKLFLRDFEQIAIHKDWVAFKNKYLIRRNNPEVWPLADWFTDWLIRHEPLDGGVIDLREYDVQSDE